MREKKRVLLLLCILSLSLLRSDYQSISSLNRIVTIVNKSIEYYSNNVVINTSDFKDKISINDLLDNIDNNNYLLLKSATMINNGNYLDIKFYYYDDYKQYEKYLNRGFERIFSNIKYDKNSQSLDDVIFSKRGSCLNVTITFYLFCKVHKIPCKMIRGTLEGIPHVWCEVKYENAWRSVDIINYNIFIDEDEDDRYVREMRFK